MILAGDDNQTLFHCENQNTGLTSIKKKFSDSEIIVLTESRRFKNNALINFFNGYLEIIKRPLKFKEVNSCLDEKPKIYFLGDKNELQQYIQKEIQEFLQIPGNKGKKIKIIASVHREIKFIKALLKDKDLNKFEFACIEENDDMLSTIHFIKGNEADFVIVSLCYRLFEPMDVQKENLLYVAMTRASEKLVIFTSFPKQNIEKLFRKGTYEEIDHQTSYKNRITMENNNPDIDFQKFCLCSKHDLIQSKPLMKDMYQDSMDSIIIQLDMNSQLPFVKHENNNIDKGSCYVSCANNEIGGIKYLIKRVNGKLNFEFLDLSLFKKLGWDDFEILQSIKIIIFNYFDYRLSKESIDNALIYRVDFSRIITTNNVASTYTVISDLCSIRKKMKDDDILVKKSPHNSLYSSLKVKKGLGICLYQPIYKTKNKIIDVSELDIKIELRVMKNYSRLNVKSLEYKLRSKENLFLYFFNKEINPFNNNICYMRKNEFESKIDLMNFVKIRERIDKKSSNSLAMNYYEFLNEEKKIIKALYGFRFTKRCKPKILIPESNTEFSSFLGEVI